MLKSYNAGDVSVIVGTRALSGFAEGSFVTVRRNEDSFAMQVGADGEVTRSKTNNKSGEIEITLQQASSDNTYLSGLLANDENNGNGIVPVTVKDRSGDSLAFGEECWIKKPADKAYARDAGETTWVLSVASLETVVGGN